VGLAGRISAVNGNPTERIPVVAYQAVEAGIVIVAGTLFDVGRAFDTNAVFGTDKTWIVFQRTGIILEARTAFLAVPTGILDTDVLATDQTIVA